MTFFNKIKWVLGIVMILVLVISTNLIDRNNFNRVKESVETIYADRLVAKDLIFEMSKAIHKKEMAIVAKDTLFFKTLNSGVNKHIETLVSQFEDTKLTSDERMVFSNLKEDMDALGKAESDYLESNLSNDTTIKRLTTAIKDSLDELSEIQIREGNRQMSISRRALNSVELFTQIEIYFLVFLAIVIQIIVMYQPKKD